LKFYHENAKQVKQERKKFQNIYRPRKKSENPFCRHSGPPEADKLQPESSIFKVLLFVWTTVTLFRRRPRTGVTASCGLINLPFVFSIPDQSRRMLSCLFFLPASCLAATSLERPKT